MAFPVMGLILVYASVSDLKEYKIRNPVVVFGWLAGIVIQTYHCGGIGMFRCISCILGTIIACMPLYHIGGVGAGDIKLFSVVSGLHGVSFAWRVGVLFVVLAGICSLCKLLKINALRDRIARMYFLFRYSPRAAFDYYLEKRGNEDFVIPLAPILAVAYFAVYMAQNIF